MSESEESTIPNTPSSFSEDVLSESEEQVFAWLRPSDPSACKAFDAALNAIITSPRDYEHTRQFIHADRRSIRATSVFTNDSTLDQHEEPQSEGPRWIGSFKFSLKTLPRKPIEGWYLGTDGHGSKTGEVDMLLAPYTQKWRKLRIAGKHARVFFHEESCRVMVEARHTVTISTATGAETLTRSKSRVLENGSMLSIGDCLYVFEYTEYSKTPSFQIDLSRFIEEHHASRWSIHKLLPPISTGETMVLGEYMCSRGAFAQGTFGQVSAGWARDGRAVAIKRFKRPEEPELKAHQKVMFCLGYHVSVMSKFCRTTL